MKILFLTGNLPYPLTDGTKLRAFNLIKSLAQSHSVYILCLDNSHLDNNTNTVYLKKLTSALEVSFNDFIVRDKCRGGMDINFIVGRDVLTNLSNIDLEFQIVDLIDDPSLRLLVNINLEPCLFKKSRLIKWWLDMRKDEREWGKKFKHFVVTAPEDALTLKSLCPNSNVEVIPNGVDIDYFAPQEIAVKHPSLLFTGVLSYPPNNDALVFFLKRIFPYIRAKIPQVKFTIIGPGVSDKVKRLCQKEPNVTLTGWVDDIRPYFINSSVYVSPLRYGTGVKNKILEAWAMQMPIVATSSSCKGLDAVNGENILIDDRPNQFASAVINLLEDKSLSAGIAKKGRELVKTRYSWQYRAGQLEELFKKVINSKVI